MKAQTLARALSASRNIFSNPKKDSRVDKNRAIKRSATCRLRQFAHVSYMNRHYVLATSTDLSGLRAAAAAPNENTTDEAPAEPPASVAGLPATNGACFALGLFYTRPPAKRAFCIGSAWLAVA